MIAAVAATVVGLLGSIILLVMQTAANRDLRAANAREIAAREQAQAQFLLAMEAIKTFHSGVSEDLLLKEKEFDALRSKLLRGARDFYGKLASLLEGQTNHSSRKALGLAGFELAELTSEVSSKPEALKAHREAMAARAALAREPGADAGSKADMAHSLLAMGPLLATSGDLVQAMKTFQEARSLLEPLVRANRPSPPTRLTLPAANTTSASFTTT